MPHSEKSWSTSFPKGLPKQKNGYDCGIFLLLYAYHIAFEERTKFGPINQTTLDRGRETIGCDILRGRFFEYGDERKKTPVVNPGENTPKPAYRSISLSQQNENDRPTNSGKLGTSLNRTSQKTIEIDTEVVQNQGNPIRNQSSNVPTSGTSTTWPKNAPPGENSHKNINPVTEPINTLGRVLYVPKDRNTYTHVCKP
jgi:hypothetical protein